MLPRTYPAHRRSALIEEEPASARPRQLPVWVLQSGEAGLLQNSSSVFPKVSSPLGVPRYENLGRGCSFAGVEGGSSRFSPTPSFSAAAVAPAPATTPDSHRPCSRS